MTRVYLIRHASTDAAGHVLAGRAAGVHLNARGRDEAARLPQRLANASLDAIYTGPLERAIETAQPLAQRHGLDTIAIDALHELDFGTWTGASIASLAGVAEWQRFNTYRSGTRIPGGESMLEVQSRVVNALAGLCRSHAEGRIAVISHGDVIRAALAHYAGIPIDLCLRLDVAPASISIVDVSADGPIVRVMNDSGELSG